MGQAADMMDPCLVVEEIVATESVGLDDSLIVAEEGSGDIAGPDGMVLIDECRAVPDRPGGKATCTRWQWPTDLAWPGPGPWFRRC